MQNNPQFPTALDTSNYLLSAPPNYGVFHVENSINVDSLQVTLVGTQTISVPTIAVFAGGEMWLVESVTQDLNSNWVLSLSDYTQRAYGGSPLQPHPANEEVYIGLLADHLNRLRDAILATQKASMRHVATLPGAPAFDGEVVFDLSQNRVYYGASGAWVWASRLSHGDLGNLTADAAHAQYMTQAEMDTWHGTLPGVHITGGDNHNHVDATQGNPVLRIDSGLLASMPTATVIGQIYFATDDRGGTLYVSANGSSWEQVSGAPDGSIAMFDSACPSGWTRVTTMDSKYPVGGSAVADGTGYTSHSHVYNQIINHYHTVAAQLVSTSSGGEHSHGVNLGGGVGGEYAASYGNGSVGTSANGSHSHGLAIQRVVANAGVTSPSTTSDNVEPPYREVVFCKKGV